MGRRRLRLSWSSDEDEAEHQQQHPTHEERSVSVASSRSNLAAAVDISDDDGDEHFIDVSESLPSPSPPSPPQLPTSPDGHCPVSDWLDGMGLRLRGEWLDSCLNSLLSSVPGFSSLDVASKAKFCFHHFLLSDMNSSGAGILPPGVDSMHLVHLPGPFVLQVDEIVNISCPLRGRYQNASAGLKRCLKLSMTDGAQRVFGIEYRPIKDLQPLASAGFKVALCNVNIRRGLLLLVPETVEVLGGVVDELEAARERLVHEVNKPPRGKRTRSGATPPLATRATLAAWPRSANNLAHNSSVTSENSHPSLGSRGASMTPSESRFHPRVSVQSNVPAGSPNTAPRSSPNLISEFEDMHVDVFPNSSAITTSSPPANFATNSAEVHVDFIYDKTLNMVSNSSRSIAPSVAEQGFSSGSSDRVAAFLDPPSSAAADNEDIQMVDDVEHPLMLSRDREIPFMYLASLSAKWATVKEEACSVQGKVKCILTGVKAFHYKQRTTYELQVYVDDGSLISEILISHNVVQRRIGHPAGEVTAALSSSDKAIASSMKETLKQFQYFLVNFEGIMLIEINAASQFPIALDMDQGSSPSDAWMLLSRLKSSTLHQERCSRYLVDPIDVLP